MIGMKSKITHANRGNFTWRQVARLQYICISHDLDSLFDIRLFRTGMRLSQTALQRNGIHPSSLGDYIEKNRRLIPSLGMSDFGLFDSLFHVLRSLPITHIHEAQVHMPSLYDLPRASSSL